MKALCRHLKVSRSGYYAWANRKPGQRAVENAALLLKIRRVYDGSKGRYGSPRVYQALRREGEQVGENRVARMMRVYRRMSKRRDELKALPNHRLSVEKPVEVNQQWSSDVTYISRVESTCS